MIGIQAIASYVPEKRVSNLPLRERFGLEEGFLENKVGVLNRSIKAEGEDTSDMCVRAFEALRKRVPIRPEEVDCLIVCTQNPDGSGLPHVSSIVHGKIGGAERCAAFDIGLGCSGFVYGLAVARSFMQDQGLTRGLLFTADPYSKIIDPDDKNTVLLFGDAAAVTLLGPDPVYSIAQARFGTRGRDGSALRCADGRLRMNGREVFNFTMTTVPQQIREVAEAAGVRMEEIDLFVLHQGSRYVVDMMAKRLALDARKVPITLAETGNTVSSTIPLILEGAMDRVDVRRVLISGFGVGLSWASAVLVRS